MHYAPLISDNMNCMNAESTVWLYDRNASVELWAISFTYLRGQQECSVAVFFKSKLFNQILAWYSCKILMKEQYFLDFYTLKHMNVLSVNTILQSNCTCLISDFLSEVGFRTCNKILLCFRPLQNPECVGIMFNFCIHCIHSVQPLMNMSQLWKLDILSTGFCHPHLVAQCAYHIELLWITVNLLSKCILQLASAVASSCGYSLLS